jgi:hypothetical protein
MAVTIRVAGFRQAGRMLGNMGARANNPRPVFELIQRDFRRIQRDHFDSQGRRGSGVKWKDISDKWRDYKVSRGFDARIMHYTHEMRDSFTRPRARYAYFRIRGLTMVMGSTAPQAGIHDPDRPLIGVRLADEREWAEWMTIYINNGFLPRTGLA